MKTVAAVLVLAALSVAVLGQSDIDFCSQLPILLGIGSSTVFPLVELYARQYEAELVAPIVRSSGSGLGIQDFLVGATDIGHASRAMDQDDYDEADCGVTNALFNGPDPTVDCQGVLPVSTLVAKDLIAVIANPNGPFSAVTIQNLEDIFTLPTPTILEVFGSGPNVAPTIVIPDRLSGTFDFFFGRLNDTIAEDFENGFIGVPNIFTFADDDLLIAKCAEEVNCIGFVGLSFVVDNSDIAVLPVEGIDPTNLDGAPAEMYKFFRPLYLYTDNNGVGVRAEQITRYVCGLLTTEGQAVVAAVDYVTLSMMEINQERSKLNCDALDMPSANFTGVNEQFKYCRDRREVIQLGSSTVFPVATVFSSLNRNDWLVLDARSAGSGPGILNLIVGATEIGTASRALRGSDYENAGCPASGVDANGIALETCQGTLPVGLNIGFDTLAVIVNPGNDWVFDISLEELQFIFSQQETVWQDLFPTAPDGAPINIVNPDFLSGTFGFFEEAVDVTITNPGFNDDEPIFSAVSSDVNAIGFLGFANVAAQPSGLVRVLTVEGVSTDDPENYPLTRPLFTYFNGLFEEQRLEIQNQLCDSISPFGQAVVEEVAYVPLSLAQTSAEIDRLRLNCVDIEKLFGIPPQE